MKKKLIKKRLFIVALSTILFLVCLACEFQYSFVNKTYTKPSDTTTEEPAVPTTVGEQPEFSDKEPVSIQLGDARIIEVSATEEKYITAWSSDNEKIAEVDDGGRIDAKSVGTTTVYASYLDGSKTKCEVNVTEAVESEDDTFSTCITANSDVLLNNIYSGSQNPYAIYVNRKMNTVTVYTYDENGDYNIPVRAMVSSCGKNNGTITGEFNTYFINDWHALYDGVYGQYVSGISGDYLFHSVPYLQPSASTLEVDEFNKLGSDASLGCVRLAAGDARWIFTNCAIGTYVKIYDDNDPGPLGKPDAITITDKSCGWDPTDSDQDNPYNSKAPEIKGAKDITIKKGEDFYLRNGVTAVDTCSNDITDKLVITGNAVNSRVGTYKITYSVKDALHRTAKADITVKVTE